jgi:hypothetical protein
LQYNSGEEVRQGDRITLHGEPGEIEVVADSLASDPVALWHLQENGQGALIHEPKVFGQVFIDPESCDWQCLCFVSRRPELKT